MAVRWYLAHPLSATSVMEHGQVLDIVYREHRDAESATAYFRRAPHRTGTAPTTVISDHHQPYLHAVQEVFPEARHIKPYRRTPTATLNGSCRGTHQQVPRRTSGREPWPEPAPCWAPGCAGPPDGGGHHPRRPPLGLRGG
jgi:transposase-like protein